MPLQIFWPKCQVKSRPDRTATRFPGGFSQFFSCFPMRQQLSRYYPSYIPECILYDQVQARSEYMDHPPFFQRSLPISLFAYVCIHSKGNNIRRMSLPKFFRCDLFHGTHSLSNGSVFTSILSQFFSSTLNLCVAS